MTSAKSKGELSSGCKTYLQEWYAGDNEPIFSKYFDKGNMVEDDCIDLMATVLNKGLAVKNAESKENEYFTGTCDVVFEDTIVDVKSCWNKKSLQAACQGLDKDYEYQLQGYCHLYDKPKAILFYGLLDTPEEVNYGIEVIYSNMPIDERWVAYSFDCNDDIIQEIINKVIKCREYLIEYDTFVKSKLGKLN
jgi:hypothetical protein